MKRDRFERQIHTALRDYQISIDTDGAKSSSGS